jgi:glycosyltransferase involved in cell wall biosynthesis
MMKVLHLLDTLERGGAETIALDVCRQAGRHGIELTVVATQSGPLEDDFRDCGAEFIRLNRRLPVDPGVVFGLRKIIKQREIQIVHGYQPVEGLHLYLATLATGTMGGGAPVKRVLSFQGGMRASRKNMRAARFLIPRMDANIAVSRGILNHHRDVDKFDVSKNFHVIYNGSDPDRFAPGGHSLKKELGLDENTRLIGMVGNFYREARKDQLTICRALPKVFAEEENLHCVFAGAPEPGAEHKLQECIDLCCAQGIAGRVHFLGARADVPDVLAALDIFIFSSLHEGLPLAVTEAMLAGVPLVVSDIEPLLEVSDGGNLAEVFPVGNDEILAEKILKLLENDRLREGMRLSAREFALENFSIDAHLKALKNLYRSLIQE